jgi:D-alanine-D-alanine ligase
MISVGVLYGGRSGEHQVSRCSAASVFEALDRSKYEVIAIGVDYDGKWYPQKDCAPVPISLSESASYSETRRLGHKSL